MLYWFKILPCACLPTDFDYDSLEMAKNFQCLTLHVRQNAVLKVDAGARAVIAHTAASSQTFNDVKKPACHEGTG
jgi:hypothetical protein